MEMFLKCLAGFLFVSFILPVVLNGVNFMWDFWDRKESEYYWGTKLQQFKWDRSDVPVFNGELGNLDWLLYWLFIEGILIAGGISSTLLILHHESVLFEVSVVIGSIILLIFAPRWVMDICKGTGYSRKDGKLEEIEDLKKRLEKLEGK